MKRSKYELYYDVKQVVPGKKYNFAIYVGGYHPQFPSSNSNCIDDKCHKNLFVLSSISYDIKNTNVIVCVYCDYCKKNKTLTYFRVYDNLYLAKKEFSKVAIV